jgi:DegV family protein with EDD domain
MAQHRIALITDSTNDLPEQFHQDFNLIVVPLYVLWGGDQLREGVDILPEEFYKRLQRDPAHPTTSQPTPQDFVSAYQQACQMGAEEIVVITISGGMSGTIQSAREAQKLVDVPVHVHDSKSTTMGLGWQVLAAARARRDGGDAQAMLAAADQALRTMQVVVVLDTFEFLYRGGRIGTATRWIGSALNIKPLVCVNHQNGLVEASSRTRTREKGIKLLYETFFDQMDMQKPLHVAVVHNDALEDGEALAERIRAEAAPLEVLLHIGSPVPGVHTGPRALALCGYYET